ncbi:HAF repeat-containing protein [Massilia sp. PAMC28688]|uniref:HAF repeat-containing protein n=1 Tax=Massilia sp. PAMC28688 TaxID=2861283 RepID=UPI001C627257|nr:HAF repeat-containing protein [Massilia sp. PAMC28688]QYF91729.1 HAF repeat-containing protein [Massilia sp. PAMC28688]
MRILFQVPLCLLGALCLAAPAARAHPEYRVTIVAGANSYAYDINNAGVVVGSIEYKDGVRGFVNRGKGMLLLGALGGVHSRAVAINNQGEVLGQWTTATGLTRGFVYCAGVQRDIGVRPGYDTFFTDINDRGYMTAIGRKYDSFEGSRSFLRAPDGRYRDIGSLPFDDPLTDAYALNNSNTITGISGPLIFPGLPVRAMMWSKGIMRDLGDVGSEPNAGYAINNAGQITGYASVPDTLHDRVATLYSKGRLIDIDRRPATVSRFSEGAGINNHGHIVGYSDHLAGFVYRGRKMQSLNAMIDPRSGWNIQFPRAINDSGQIAATAYRNGQQYAVRLDLIRPHLLQLPMPDDGEQGPDAGPQRQQ